VRYFIAAIEGYYDEPQGKQKLNSFVIKSKIQGTAKTKIGSAEKNLLLEKCGCLETQTM
jgi:hypothetical protein